MARIRPATVIAGLGVLIIGLAPRLCAGQSAQSASLVGKVTDESGGAMAGVTVTLKSPALQVPQATTVTGADGDYRLLELPPGVYMVTFELTGFQTSARTDVHLTTGSAGRVDVVMKIGALSETVQVSGLSPVVDTVNVAGQTTLVQEQLRSIPMGGTMQEMLPLAAGLSMQTKPDVGDSNLASRSAIITYGVILQTTLDIEGINIRLEFPGVQRLQRERHHVDQPSDRSAVRSGDGHRIGASRAAGRRVQLLGSSQRWQMVVW